MKTCLLALTLAFSAFTAQAADFTAARCILASAALGAPDWQANAFILEKSAAGFSASNDTSGRNFELTPLSASEVQGFPVYDGGTYYKGGNDLWVIVTKNLAPHAVYQVIKPYEDDLNTGTRPAIYDCFKTM